MNTFSNFSTFNGWRMPGSGTWVTRNSADNFYVDENGDLWVPCICVGTGSSGGIGDTGAAAGSIEIAASPVEPAVPAGAWEEAMLRREMAFERRMDEMLEIVRRLEQIHASELNSVS